MSADYEDVTVDGKYTVRMYRDGRVEARRYGSEWIPQVTAGANMVRALACEIGRLRDQLRRMAEPEGTVTTEYHDEIVAEAVRQIAEANDRAEAAEARVAELRTALVEAGKAVGQFQESIETRCFCDDTVDLSPWVCIEAAERIIRRALAGEKGDK